jgi:hypothetical protein
MQLRIPVNSNAFFTKIIKENNESVTNFRWDALASIIESMLPAVFSNKTNKGNSTVTTTI